GGPVSGPDFAIRSGIVLGGTWFRLLSRRLRIRECALPHRVLGAKLACIATVEAHLIVLDRDWLEQFRKNVADTVHGSIEQYAAVLGLQPDSKFQQDLNEALFSCILIHWNMPNRKRYSDIRKELLRVDKEAAAATKILRRLQAALDD